MHQFALSLAIIATPLVAQTRTPGISHGTIFQYRSWGTCTVMSGAGPDGVHTFQIEYRLQNGEVLKPILDHNQIKSIESLLKEIGQLSYSLPYKEPVFQFDGESVKIELFAGSYNLTYEDSLARAGKQSSVAKLSKILLSLQPKSTQSIHEPIP